MPSKFMQMNNQELRRFLEKGGVLVDVRCQNEWHSTGVVAGSLLLTFFAEDGSSEPQRWLAELNRKVSSDQSLALICRSGYRTGLIGDFLAEVNARPEIYHLIDGLRGWLAEGFPVVSVGDAS